MAFGRWTNEIIIEGSLYITATIVVTQSVTVFAGAAARRPPRWTHRAGSYRVGSAGKSAKKLGKTDPYARNKGFII